MVNTDRLCMSCMNDNGGEKICSICGYDSSKDNPSHLLSIGTWINANRYLIGKVIEEGGDGVTYIGWDNDINAVVNIREYFPTGLAVRSSDRMTVSPAADKGLAFNRGMNEFVSLFTSLEAMSPATAILKTVEVFEANGTVYSVAQTVSGITLKAFLLRNGGALKWEQLRPLFMPLLSSVRELHEKGIVHRAISPDTIIVGRDGKLYLTGFSIKDSKISGTDFAVALSSGYAAPEQYGYLNADSNEKSDIYALGAVMFRCLIGTALPDANERINNDSLSIPAKVTETIPRNVLGAIANTLKVNPSQRTTSADRLKQMLEIPPDSPKEEVEVKKNSTSSGKTAIIASLITASVFIVLFIILFLTAGKDLFGGKDDTASVSSADSYYTPSFSLPGEQDPNVDPDPEAKTYEVPNYSKMTYAEIMDNDELNERFEIFIVGKEYSDLPRGQVTRQTIDPGKKVVKDTEIGLYVSLGPSTVSMPKILGLEQKEAYIVLLEAGFLPQNIEFTNEIYDDTATPSVVLRATYNEGDKVSLDDALTVYINSYKGEEENPYDDNYQDTVG
ncbi:MAG: PASTA domain-containing protein [Clostridia bacterium]|nr:PASTA domain-containing protein [Clostridia bacterium]